MLLRTSLVSIALALTLVTATPACGDAITLKSSIRVAADATTITLRDVAYLEGDAALQLADTVLFNVDDLSGTTADITLDQVRTKIAATGAKVSLMDWTGKAVTIRVPTLDRPSAMRGMTVDPAAGPRVVAPTVTPPPREEFLALDMKDALTPRGLLADLIATAHSERNVAVRLIVEGADAALLDDTSRSLRHEIVPLTALTADLVRARIVTRDGDTVVRRTDITVHPTLEAQVATAKSSVRRNAHLDGGLVDIAAAWVTPSEFAKLVDVSMIENAITVTTIAKGTRVLQDMVRKPIEIKKNDKVVVRREMGSVAIELTAVADEEGGVGDTIRFFALDRKDRKDRKSFTAVVTGPGRAVLRDEA